MAKPFRHLLEAMPANRRKQVEARKQMILAEVRLGELRKAVELTQQQLAETLNINQAAISKMESQSDMYISTLRRVIKAMGGVKSRVSKCANSGVATVKVTVKGSTGRVSSARASGVSGSTKSCVERAVKRARFPKFKQSTFSVSFPFRL